MELQEQLERIEQLKSDKYMKLLAEGLKAVNGLDKFSANLLENHKAKNETINAKLRNYKEDLVDRYSLVTDEFYLPASKEILKFCGFHEEDDIAGDFIFDYSDGNLSFDEMIEKFKQYAIEVDNIPEGHVMLKTDNEITHIPEDVFDKWFPDDDE